MLEPHSFLVHYCITVGSYFVRCKKLFACSVLQKCCKTNSLIWAVSANPHKHWVFRHIVAHSDYSHSIVAGGLLVMSYTTRLTPFTSLTMRLEAAARTSSGIRAQSAVMKSVVDTARRAMV